MMKLKGLYSAPFTAFDADGEIDLDVVDEQAAALIANGVKGAIVCGTTGESSSMTNAERMTVLERWCRFVRGGQDFKIIAHVGHTSLKDCIELTRHASETGADLVAALPPYYFKPSGVDEIVDFCAEIAAAAPELPFYYYHIPSLSGVFLPMVDLLEAIDGKIPNFAGIKYTYEDLYDMARCMDVDNGRYDILCGRDEILLAGLALGSQAAVGSTYNYIAPVYVEMMSAFAAGDLAKARKMQNISREVIAIMVKFGGMSAAKRIMKLVGIDCGQVRLPMVAMTAERLDEMASALSRVGFDEYASTKPEAIVHSSR